MRAQARRRGSCSHALRLCLCAACMLLLARLACRAALQDPHFRPLWVSYCTPEGEVESFSIYLAEPSRRHPKWLKWAGYFSTLHAPVPLLLTRHPKLKPKILHAPVLCIPFACALSTCPPAATACAHGRLLDATMRQGLARRNRFRV